MMYNEVIEFIAQYFKYKRGRMIKKKNAFTLAEVLITLAIIGVVAALTMPALTNNVGGAKIGPRLAKFVNIFETATQNLMSEGGYDSLSTLVNTEVEVKTGKTTKKVNAYLDELSNYMQMVPPAEGVYFDTGDDPDEHHSYNTYVLKDGTSFHFIPRSPEKKAIYNPKGSYKGAVAFLYVNVAGASTTKSTDKTGVRQIKHRLGREVFKFMLDDSGVLIPQGSRIDYYLRDYYSPNQKDKDGNEIFKCNPDSKIAEQRAVCTGAIADNGWKVPKGY